MSIPATNKKKVLVIQGLHQVGLDMLAARDDVETVVLMSADEAEIAEAAKDVHGITVRTANVTRKVIEGAGNLAVVSRHGVGYDAVDVGALSERGIPLTIAIHSNMISVAEHAMFLLLSLAKNVFYYDAMTRKSEWGNRWDIKAWDLAETNLLIVGLGRIGSRVAKRAAAFDMKVFVHDPYIDQAVIKAAGCTPVADFRAVLPDMDAVTIHCPRNEETIGMFSGPEFEAMKAGSFIVNCARGAIIDEAALYIALTTGRVRGAGLDVFDVEPSPASNPLFGLDNVILSPHIAGVTIESTIRMATQTVQNVLDVFDGKVDPAVVVNQQVLK
jgi:D-3-phosphoglycerate dehydrogenase